MTEFRKSVLEDQTVDVATPVFGKIASLEAHSALELARAGNVEAYGEVYRAYAPRLLRQAMVLCGNDALAEELAQDTLVEAWKCLRRYDGRCAFFTWLCAILLNRYRNNVNRNRLVPMSALGPGKEKEIATAAQMVADQSAAPDQAAALNEQSIVLRRCIQSLALKHQEVIYLRFYVDDSLEGIAAALGCSVGTVKSRLFYALDKLRGMNALAGHFLNTKENL